MRKISIGKRIKILREREGMTQAELANKLETSQALVSHYERNDQQSIPPSASIIKLSRLFRVSTDYLLGLEDLDPQANKIEQCSRCKRVRETLFNLRSVTKNVADELRDLKDINEEP